MSDQEWKDYVSYLRSDECECAWKEIAADKLRELDDRRIERESCDRKLNAVELDPFIRSLRSKCLELFQQSVAKEKIKWTPFTTPQNAPGSFNLDFLRSIPIDSFYAFLKPRETEARVTALCPFHEEGTPSFVLFRDKNNYYCFGCGEHGSSIDFVMKWQELPFKEACRWLSTVDNSIDKNK